MYGSFASHARKARVAIRPTWTGAQSSHWRWVALIRGSDRGAAYDRRTRHHGTTPPRRRMKRLQQRRPSHGRGIASGRNLADGETLRLQGDISSRGNSGGPAAAAARSRDTDMVPEGLHTREGEGLHILGAAER